MITKLSHVTIVVRDQDKALQWYTEKLGLEKRMDGLMEPGMRWLTVGVPGQPDVEIVLHKPVSEAECEGHGGPSAEDIGKGTVWVFATGDCRRTHDELAARGVTFVRSPEDVPWGVQAVFEDLYGNRFALVQTR